MQKEIQPTQNQDLFIENHMAELRRRADVQKYFLGAGDFRSGEGFGHIVGGGLAIFMGAFLFPLLLGGHTDSGVERYLFWGLTLAGIVMALWGIFLMYKEDKTPRTPISDERFDQISRYDIEKTKREAQQVLIQNFALPEDSEFIHLVGPNYYTANRHIPILWKVDGAGRIRYSNFALVTLVFTEDSVYSHTCIVNHRDGIFGKSHAYRYHRDALQEVLIEDREIERVTTEQKIEEKHVSLLMIRVAGKEDVNELSVVLSDRDIAQKLGGHFEETEVRQAAEKIAALIKKTS